MNVTNDLPQKCNFKVIRQFRQERDRTVAVNVTNALPSNAIISIRESIQKKYLTNAVNVTNALLTEVILEFIIELIGEKPYNCKYFSILQNFYKYAKLVKTFMSCSTLR